MNLRTATPADLQTLFTEMGRFAALLTDVDNLTLRDVLAAFQRIEAALVPFAPPPILEELGRLRATLPAAEPKEARDWAGFFAAIAAFVQTVLPLILPLFKK